MDTCLRQILQELFNLAAENEKLKATIQQMQQAQIAQAQQDQKRTAVQAQMTAATTASGA